MSDPGYWQGAAVPWQQILALLREIVAAINAQRPTSPTINIAAVPAPLHNTSPGTAGQISYDAGFFYVCIATNSWARVAIGGAW